MTDATDDQRAAIETALKHHLEDDQDPGVVIVKWFAVVEYVSTSREETNLCLSYSDNLRTWEMAGMADWAAARAAAYWGPRDGD